MSARLDILERQIDEVAAARATAERTERVIITPDEAR
jgi:hypothetical protein